jgi:hypothetical protein
MIIRHYAIAVAWVNLTESYWVRARPEQILEAAKALR